jgi:hypothetical protein
MSARRRGAIGLQPTFMRNVAFVTLEDAIRYDLRRPVQLTDDEFASLVSFVRDGLLDPALGRSGSCVSFRRSCRAGGRG